MNVAGAEDIISETYSPRHAAGGIVGQSNSQAS